MMYFRAAFLRTSLAAIFAATAQLAFAQAFPSKPIEFVVHSGAGGATMEAAFKRAHDSAVWKEFAARNMYEDTYLNSAEFSQWLRSGREEMREFLTAIGVIQKP